MLESPDDIWRGNGNGVSGGMIKTLSGLPVIETKRLRLAPLSVRDARALRELTDDPAITTVIHFLHSPFTLSDAVSLIEQKGDGRDQFIGAWNREDGGLIGTVGTHMRDPDELEIGYWIASAVHGRGYGYEAVRAIVMLLQQEFPKSRIIAECRLENTVSWHLLEKLGFEPTGEAGTRPGRRLLVLADSKSAS
jgi:RimJ/RimL family protein N-acetyltransferase